MVERERLARAREAQVIREAEENSVSSADNVSPLEEDDEIMEALSNAELADGPGLQTGGLAAQDAADPDIFASPHDLPLAERRRPCNEIYEDSHSLWFCRLLITLAVFLHTRRNASF